jgi:hypothetical protein
VILFQDVIEILQGAVLAMLSRSPAAWSPAMGEWISGVLVGIDDPRRRMILTALGFGQAFFQARK